MIKAVILKAKLVRTGAVNILSNWVLRYGSWSDSGVWIDSETWSE